MDYPDHSKIASKFIRNPNKELDPNKQIEIKDIAAPFLTHADQNAINIFSPVEGTESSSSQATPPQPIHQNTTSSLPIPSASNKPSSPRISVSRQVTEDCTTRNTTNSTILEPQATANPLTESIPLNTATPIPNNYTVPAKPHPQTKQMQYYRRQNAFREVFTTPEGLVTFNPCGEPFIFFHYHVKSCYFVKLDPQFSQKSYYHISFWEKTDPLIISDDDLKKPRTLAEILSTQLPSAYENWPSKNKINTAIQSFFMRSATLCEIRFYTGWTKTNGLWAYNLQDNKTHGSKDFSAKEYIPLNIDPSHSGTKDFSLSVQLTAVRQTAEMMNIITDNFTRNIIFDILHIASLFSLLSGLNKRFPFGFCIHCKDALTQSILETLLSWFSDPIINLSEKTSRFYTFLTERKDQPLLIMDAKAQMANTNMLEDAINTGIITNRKSQNKLHALPVVLSNFSSHISQSSKFIRFNLQSQQFAENAMQTIREKHGYFMSYLYYFNIFVQEHIAEFQNALTKHTDSILNNYTDHSLSKDCSVALGIIRAVEEIAKSYHASLYPDKSTEQMLRDLFPEQTEDSWVDTFSYMSCQDSDTTIVNVFFNTANQMIQADNFDIREFGDDNTFAPCPDTKHGIIYIYNNDPCLSNEAFDAVVDCTGYQPGIIKQALKRAGAFNGAFANNDGYQYRISGKNPLTGKDITPVYRFTTESIKIPRRPHTSIINKKPDECNFSLELGTSINGDPIIWYGMMSSHICITGKTGSGKSYFLKKQIIQLPAQNTRCIIFDTKGTFTSTDPKKSPPEWFESNIDIINMSNSKAQHIFFQPLFANESNNTIISRFVEVVKKATVLGDNQKNELIKILGEGLSNKEISNFTDLINSINTKTKTAKKESPLVPKINEMNRILPYGEEPFDLRLDKPEITILDFYNGFDKRTVSTVADLILSVISDSRLARESDNDTPIILVLDECQIFDWRGSSPAHTILTQGREKGLSIWFCTQYPEQVNDPKVLGQADFHVHFRPGENDISKISKIICRNTHVKTQICENQLTSLVPGQFMCKINNEVYISEVPIKSH